MATKRFRKGAGATQSRLGLDESMRCDLIPLAWVEAIICGAFELRMVCQVGRRTQFQLL